jgi:hypothetical protein
MVDGGARARWWWAIVGVVLAVVVAAGLAACAGPASAQTGDCVAPTDDTSYTRVDCAGAQLKVLERIDSTDADCAAVAGVTESFTDYDSDYSLCLGPVDTDPATAVNVAQVGACLSGIDAQTGVGGADVRQVDCADPQAGAQVLSREEDAFPIGPECGDVAGSTASYSWSLNQTSSTGLPAPSINTTDVLFCLGPAGVDPATSPDAAQVGDCLRETAEDPGYAKVDCGAPDAGFRVVERIDNGLVPVEVACDSAPGAVGGVGRSGLDGYVLCLAEN